MISKTSLLEILAAGFRPLSLVEHSKKDERFRKLAKRLSGAG